MPEQKTNVNHIDIFFKPNTNLHSFCIGAYLLAGSMYETAGNNGISHLYEHAVFRNLKRFYGENFYTLLSQNGILIEGETYKEFMSFTVHGLTDGIDFAIDLVSKLFLPLQLDPKEFDDEKQRIYLEINENNEKSTLDWLHNRRCWDTAFPAGGITGKCSNLKKITVKKLNNFRKNIISCGNLFFYITGNINSEHEKKLIETIRHIPLNPVCINRENIVPLKPNFVFGKQNIVIKDSDWYKVKLAFGFNSYEIPMNVREMLYSILYDLDDCIFCQELSENDPSVYSYGGTLEQYNNVGCFHLTYETTEKQLEKSLEATVRAINKVKHGDFDLELNKRKLIVQQILLCDDPESQNWDLAYYHHILESGPADWSKPDFGRFENLTKDEIINAAKKIYTRKSLVITLRGDRRKINKGNIENILSELN